ncbi:unnamed protein product, partial [Adineta steineri]
MEQEPNEIDQFGLEESTSLENEESRKRKRKKRNRNSRPSQKKKKNRYTKPSAQLRNTTQLERFEETNIVFPSESNWSIFHPPIEENSERQLLYEKCINFTPSAKRYHCPYASYRNKLEISILPEDLILGFMEQRAITLKHVYMSIIIIRGHQ